MYCSHHEVESVGDAISSPHVNDPEGTGEINIGLKRVLQMLVLGFCWLGHVDSGTG